LKCLFKREVDESERGLRGVGQTSKLTVYVSPIDLETATGSADFPDYVRNSYARISATFDNDHYEVTSIEDVEPLEIAGTRYVIAYKIILVSGTGDTDFD
jgi:hypothetical protein